MMLAFDFESLNKTLFYDQYERVNSYFFGLPFASKGLPTGDELEILTSVKDMVPPEVFTTEYVSPVGGDPAKLRENLRQALELLTSAGYTLNGNQLVDAGGTQLTFEILLNGPTIEPVATAWQTNLRSIGIEASIRSVDSAEYINRVRSRDFEMIYSGWAQSMSLGNEQYFFFGSESANDENSSNYAGIADPGVDALIEKVVFAKDREELLAASAALDRVLLVQLLRGADLYPAQRTRRSLGPLQPPRRAAGVLHRLPTGLVVRRSQGGEDGCGTIGIKLPDHPSPVWEG